MNSYGRFQTRLPRTLVVLALTIGLSGCGEIEADDSSEDRSEEVWEEGPAEFCEGNTRHRWSLDDPEDVHFFPDPLILAENEGSPTGFRIEVSEETVPWLEAVPDLLADGVQSFNGRSGFGSVGGILLRFEGPGIETGPSDLEESLSGGGWILAEIRDSGEVTRVPFEVEILEEGATAIVWPLRPLRMGATHAFVVTREASDREGNCIQPSPVTAALLARNPLEHPHGEEVGLRMQQVLETLEIQRREVSILLPLTVHAEPLDWLEIIAEEDSVPIEWGNVEGCTVESGLEECTVWMSVTDRRDATGNVRLGVSAEPQWTPVTFWRPEGVVGPTPVVMYGHGLSSTRTEGRFAAELFAEYGVTTVAMDAISHGDHPSAEGGSSTTAALGFLGIDLTSVSINPSLLRGNFEQTNLDRRRLVRHLVERPDWDGDGEADVDPSKLGYLGVSLGAILGSQLLATSPEFDAAIFSVGGGRLMNIVTDTSELDAYFGLITVLIGSEERFARLVPIAQHIIDPADPALWGAHILEDRLDGAEPPHLLSQVAMEDEVVPISAGHMMARSLSLPHMLPIAEEVPTLESVEGPLEANGPEGRTIGFFQFDRVSNSGSIVPATHVATPKSLEAQWQMKEYFRLWLETGIPVIKNPYSALETPVLEEN